MLRKKMKRMKGVRWLLCEGWLIILFSVWKKVDMQKVCKISAWGLHGHSFPWSMNQGTWNESAASRFKAEKVTGDSLCHYLVRDDFLSKPKIPKVMWAQEATTCKSSWRRNSCYKVQSCHIQLRKSLSGGCLGKEMQFAMFHFPAIIISG